MGMIIALKGKANSGKSTTIRYLRNNLIENGYIDELNATYNPASDFISMFDIKGKKIGITSKGDTYDDVNSALSDFENKECEIIICACRTRDNGKPGTNAAIFEFKNYQPIFIKKTFEESKLIQNSKNEEDMQELHKELFKNI